MKFIFLLGALAVSAFAQPEYWPLTAGNQWVYNAGLGGPFTVEVTGTEAANGRTYAVVRGFQGDAGGVLRLRQDGERLMVWDGRQERVYLDFGAPVGRAFATAAHECSPTAAIANRDAAAKLPLGDFGGLIEVRYNIERCADVGLTGDLFLPYIGLMRRTSTSIAGPVHHDLVYARINGVVMVSVPETGFGVSVAPSGVGAGANWMVRMTLRTAAPLRLDFSSGQTFDISVKNEKGETVYFWSADKSFLAMLQSIDVRGEKNWVAAVPVPRGAGRYTVEAWLTTMGGVPYRASVLATVE